MNPDEDFNGKITFESEKKEFDVVDRIRVKEFFEGYMSGLLELYENYLGIHVIDVYITRDNGAQIHIINEESSHG